MNILIITNAHSSTLLLLASSLYIWVYFYSLDQFIQVELLTEFYIFMNFVKFSFFLDAYILFKFLRRLSVLTYNIKYLLLKRPSTSVRNSSVLPWSPVIFVSDSSYFYLYF